ncbi:MAG: TSUP family transporter [candidate division Zixibacteria bacterium]|nr:TSUP family transporter [candidate division Zixibacteria bacterium]
MAVVAGHAAASKGEVPQGRTIELVSWLALGVLLIAFGCELVDSTLGMGYGTTLTPVLLLFGFTPLQVVPAVLLSELVTGISAAFAHHRARNVDLRPGTRPFKVAMVLAACSVVGTVVAVLIAINIPRIILKTWIGVLVLAVGILILVQVMRQALVRFSWAKVMAVGTLASFNKGMSGGGYGPLVCGGQLLSGIESKNAIAITSLAEGLTCVVGVTAYLLTKEIFPWRLALPLAAGALASVPLSALAVKKIKAKPLTIAIGVLTTFLGIFTLLKTYVL